MHRGLWVDPPMARPRDDEPNPVVHIVLWLLGVPNLFLVPLLLLT